MADSYLIDLSAWTRSSHKDVVDRWRELVEHDHVIAHPVFAVELLHNARDRNDYGALRHGIETGFDWVWPDTETANIAMAMQADMAAKAPTAQRVKTADLLIAALAFQSGHGVLHYDRDYDLIRKFGRHDFDSEWLAPRGSLETAAQQEKTARGAYKKAFGERMIQLQDNGDLSVWPAIIELLDNERRERGLELPPPPDLP